MAAVKLALRALSYGVDKLPEEAFEKVPGNFYKPKDKDSSNRSQSNNGGDRNRSNRDQGNSRRTRSESRRNSVDNYNSNYTNYNDQSRMNGYSYNDQSYYNNDSQGRPRSTTGSRGDRKERGGRRSVTPPPSDPSPGVPQEPTEEEAERGYKGSRGYSDAPYFPPPPTRAFDEPDSGFRQHDMRDYHNDKERSESPYEGRERSDVRPIRSYPPNLTDDRRNYSPHAGAAAAAAATAGYEATRDFDSRSPSPPRRQSWNQNRSRPTSMGASNDRYRPEGYSSSYTPPVDNPWASYRTSPTFAPPPGSNAPYGNPSAAGSAPYVPYQGVYPPPAVAVPMAPPPYGAMPMSPVGMGDKRSGGRSRLSFADDGASRSESRDGGTKSKLGRVKERFDTSERGLGASALGAIAGGFVGHEVGHNKWGTLAGVVMGGLGANALESQHARKKAQRRSYPRDNGYSSD